WCERLARSSLCKLEIIFPRSPYVERYCHGECWATLYADLCVLAVKIGTLLRRRVTYVLLTPARCIQTMRNSNCNAASSEASNVRRTIPRWLFVGQCNRCLSSRRITTCRWCGTEH